MFEEKDWNSGSNIKVDFKTIKKKEKMKYNKKYGRRLCQR